MTIKKITGLVAVALAAAVVCVAATMGDQDIERDVAVHEGSTTYVWHFRGNDLDRVTIYTVDPAQANLIKKEVTLKRN